MHLLHFFLVVLLGLLAPATTTATATAAVPGKRDDVTTRNVGQDLSLTAENDLAARQADLSMILLRWDVVCGTLPNTEEAPGEKRGSKIFLTSGHCRTWFKCKSDGKDLGDSIHFH